MRNPDSAIKGRLEKNSKENNTLLEFEKLNQEYETLSEPIKHLIKQGADYNLDSPFKIRYDQNSVYYGFNTVFALKKT